MKIIRGLKKIKINVKVLVRDVFTYPIIDVELGAIRALFPSYMAAHYLENVYNYANPTQWQYAAWEMVGTYTKTRNSTWRKK